MRWSLPVLMALLMAGCVHYTPRPLPADRTLESLEQRRLSDPGLAAFISQATGRPADAWPPRDLGFEPLSLIALYFHPSLGVARAQWAVTRAGETSAQARPNPTLSAQPGYDFSASGGANPWIPGVTIDWPVETAGKRGHRMDRARQLSEAARLGVLQTAWQVRGTLRTALLDLTAARRREELVSRQVETLGAVSALLQERLEAGAASRLELAPYELARVKSAGELADARRQAVEARGRVAEAVGVPLAALDGFDLRMDLATPPPPTDPGNPPALHRTALRNRADVRALLAEYAASEAALQLEVAKQYPDLRLGPGYQWDQGDSKWTLAIALELPVLNRNQGPIAEAGARRAEVAARFAALQARVVADVDRAFAGVGAARDQVDRARQLLEAHTRQLDLLRAARDAGAADTLEMRTAEVEAGAAALVLLDAQVRERQLSGELEQAIQSPLAGQQLVTPAAPPPTTRTNR